MIPVYNEGDVVGQVIEQLLSEGIELVVLDNGSTDDSYKIVKDYGKKILSLRRLETSTYDWPLILRILYDMALKENPDWLIHSDADEFLESGKNGISLKDEITKVDGDGKNLIQFDCFEFFMTDKDNLSEPSIKKKFYYYSWQADFMYRAWKYIPAVRPEVFGGHIPVFPPFEKYKIADRKFVLRHYRFRDEQQARKKIEARLIRIKETVEEKLSSYPQYAQMLKVGFPKLVNHKLLSKYEEDNNWNYKWRYHPYSLKELANRGQIFSENGKLNQPQPTYTELKYQLKLFDEKIKNLKAKLEKNS